MAAPNPTAASRFETRSGRLQAWHAATDSWRDADIDQLVRRVGALPEGDGVDLFVRAKMSRKEAVDRGAQVAGPILTVLRALAPVYGITVARR